MEKYAVADGRKRLLTAGALRACGIRATDRVLAAFSGGADSTALLLSLMELLSEGGIAGLYAAHLDHGIRGAAGEADRAYCERFCAERGIPILSERADAPALAKNAGMTLEEAARALRYEFLERARLRAGADCIAVAHQRDDQAETVLLHLLRGCGASGLCGMKPRTGAIARPLLGVSRADIESYLAERGVGWRTDETNAQCDALRNRVRNELLPVLRQYNPRISEALVRTAGLCVLDEAYLCERAAEAEAAVRLGDGFDRRLLNELPLPLKARIVRERLLGDGGAVSEADIRRVLALCGAKTGTRIELRGGRSAWTDAEALHIGRYPEALTYEVPFRRDGVTKTPAGRMTASRAAAYRRPENAFEAYLALDALPEDLVVRTRRDGDRFHPLGAPGTRKLSDVLTDKKIPSAERDLPLLCAGNEVYFAVGLAVSEKARVRPETREILHIVFSGGKVP